MYSARSICTYRFSFFGEILGLSELNLKSFPLYGSGFRYSIANELYPGIYIREFL